MAAENYGKLLREAREGAGLGPSELAEKLGVKYITVWNLEGRQTFTPSAELIEKWVEVCRPAPDLARRILLAAHTAGANAHGLALYKMAAGDILPALQIPVLVYTRGGSTMGITALPETTVHETTIIPDDGVSKHGQVFGFYMGDTCMMPEVQKGDLLVVYAEREALAGALAVVCVDGAIVCAVWQPKGDRVTLKCHNRKCKTRTHPLSEVTWAHPVARIMRTVLE